MIVAGAVKLVPDVGDVTDTDGAGVVAPATNCMKSRFATAPLTWVSSTSRATCVPLDRVTVLVTVLQFCQPPVLGTVTGPVTFVPFISRWNVAPPVGEARPKVTT